MTDAKTDGASKFDTDADKARKLMGDEAYEAKLNKVKESRGKKRASFKSSSSSSSCDTVIDYDCLNSVDKMKADSLSEWLYCEADGKFHNMVDPDLKDLPHSKENFSYKFAPIFLDYKAHEHFCLGVELIPALRGKRIKSFCFEPGEDREVRGMYNRWNSPVEPVDYTQNPDTLNQFNKFLQFLDDYIEEDAERLAVLDGLYYTFVFPKLKIKWANCLVGVAGTGKSLLTEDLPLSVLGLDMVMFPTIKSLEAGWNDYVRRSKLVTLVELHKATKVDIHEATKSMITQEHIVINERFTGDRTVKIHTNIMGNSNHLITFNNITGDRRWNMIQLRDIKYPSKADKSDYFAPIWDMVQNHAGWFMHFFKYEYVKMFPDRALKPHDECLQTAVGIMAKEASEEAATPIIELFIEYRRRMGQPIFNISDILQFGKITQEVHDIDPKYWTGRTKLSEAFTKLGCRPIGQPPRVPRGIKRRVMYMIPMADGQDDIRLKKFKSALAESYKIYKSYEVEEEFEIAQTARAIMKDDSGLCVVREIETPDVGDNSEPDDDKTEGTTMKGAIDALKQRYDELNPDPGNKSARKPDRPLHDLKEKYRNG